MTKTKTDKERRMETKAVIRNMAHRPKTLGQVMLEATLSSGVFILLIIALLLIFGG